MNLTPPLCPPPATQGAARAVAAPAAPVLGAGNLKGPNLDLAGKLVKRGSVIAFHGYFSVVQRVRTGRCLVQFSGDHPKWLSCRSVQVVKP